MIEDLKNWLSDPNAFMWLMMAIGAVSSLVPIVMLFLVFRIWRNTRK